MINITDNQFDQNNQYDQYDQNDQFEQYDRYVEFDQFDKYQQYLYNIKSMEVNTGKY